MIECILVAGTLYFDIEAKGFYEHTIMPVSITSVKIDHKINKETIIYMNAGETYASISVEYDPAITSLSVVSLCEEVE